MGKLTDALRGVALPQQTKAKVIRLDREHDELEAQVQALNAKVLHLEAEVNPLKRTIERLEQQIEQKRAPSHGPLHEITEGLLKLIANNPAFVDGNLRDELRLTTAQLDYQLDLLKSAGLVAVSAVGPRGARYHATPAGRQYLVDNGML